MSATPQSDSALHQSSEASDHAPEPPTLPWHSPPLRESVSTLELEADDFDFHDTIPAPPWLDEPLEALEAPLLPAR